SQRPGAAGLGRTAIQPAEAEAVLARVLAAPAGPQVLVSTVDLPARVERWIHRAGMPVPPAGDEEAGRGRPALASPYVPPRNELEELIAGVWRELFGFEEIGVFDDFYALGGHSLLGTQVAARLRDLLRVELPLRELLEHTTVADLAKMLAARQVEDTEPEDLEQFLAQLEAMSDEEAAAHAD
ncbi:MAG TPA: phosphopantetheine-binding protein, partial [Thermoanaerobaculia bacterium]|nr:phosphopantetheine-binding protein [Thermoanaerobaculia bacterium]